MVSDLNKMECVTLFVDDVAASRKFYEDIFGLTTVFSDDVSAVVRLESLLINILKVSQAPELISPLKFAERAHGSRMMFTIKVQNVDDVCGQLEKHGVKLLNGPVNRPWGRRTAAFADPAGHAWEVAQDI